MTNLVLCTKIQTPSGDIPKKQTDEIDPGAEKSVDPGNATGLGSDPADSTGGPSATPPTEAPTEATGVQKDCQRDSSERFDLGPFSIPTSQSNLPNAEALQAPAITKDAADKDAEPPLTSSPGKCKSPSFFDRMVSKRRG